MKDNTDQDSWFSAKPILVGNLNRISGGTELWSHIACTINDTRSMSTSTFVKCFLWTLGSREDSISEYLFSEGLDMDVR